MLCSRYVVMRNVKVGGLVLGAQSIKTQSRTDRSSWAASCTHTSRTQHTWCRGNWRQQVMAFQKFKNPILILFVDTTLSEPSDYFFPPMASSVDSRLHIAYTTRIWWRWFSHPVWPNCSCVLYKEYSMTFLGVSKILSPLSIGIHPEPNVGFYPAII